MEITFKNETTARTFNQINITKEEVTTFLANNGKPRDDITEIKITGQEFLLRLKMILTLFL